MTKPRNMTALEQRAYDGIIALVELAHKTAKDAGWYRNPKTGRKVKRNFGEVVALMHSELSEALEHDRKGTNDKHLKHRNGVEVEFGDVFLRIGDTAGANGLDVAGSVIEKNRFNQRRKDHKLSTRGKRNGKRY